MHACMKSVIPTATVFWSFHVNSNRCGTLSRLMQSCFVVIEEEFIFLYREHFPWQNSLEWQWLNKCSMKRKFTLFAMCVLCQTLGPSCRCLCLNYHEKNQETLRSRRRRTLHKFSIIYIFDTRLIGPNAQVIFKQLLGLNDNKSRKRLICFSKHIMNMHI